MKKLQKTHAFIQLSSFSCVSIQRKVYDYNFALLPPLFFYAGSSQTLLKNYVSFQQVDIFYVTTSVVGQSGLS